MADLTGNFNSVTNSMSGINSNAKGIGNSINKMKNPKNFVSASVELSNSAINLASNVGNLQRSINNLFYNDRDVVDQDINIMRGNHYVSGYEKIPFQPLFEPLIPPVAKDIMGFNQDIRTQTLVDYDMENFKYTLDRQKDHPDYYYEDPLLVSFDIMFDDYELSPLFNGEVDNFFETYLNNAENWELTKAWNHYTKFKELFFKIFNATSHPEKKSNKVWYINSILGLDKLTAKMPKYTEDKLTITLSEDIAMLVNYMIDSYNNFAYNYTQQRYNIPDNLLRFKMMIQFTDLRTMKLVDHFETPDYIYDKATQIYTLYDCNFDFFNSKNFVDEVIVGGYGAASNNTPSTVKFDIIYKSIQKEFRTPLIKGERNNIVNNKEIDVPGYSDLTGNVMNFRNNLKRTLENELELKDILKGAFGAVNMVNNMLQNFIPKFQPNIPILPPDALQSVYDNSNNNPDLAQKFRYNNPDQMKFGNLEIPDPLQKRKDLITKFMQLTPKKINSIEKNRMKNLGFIDIKSKRNTKKDLGVINNKVVQRSRKNLGFDFQNIIKPHHNNLGFISLFLKTPMEFISPIIPFVPSPKHDDLGYNYINNGTPTHDDLGIDYINLGKRPPMDNVILFGKEIIGLSNLGSVYINSSELVNNDLGLDFDNTGERQLVPLNTLYDNFVEKQQIELGSDFTNLEKTDIESKLGESFINVSKKVEETKLPKVYESTVKQLTQEMGVTFIGKDKPSTDDMGDVFSKTNKEQTQDMGVTFIGKDKTSIDDMGNVFDNTSSKTEIILDKVYNNKDKSQEGLDLDSVYNNISNKTNVNLDKVYNNDVMKKTNLEGEIVSEQNTGKKENIDLGDDFINESDKKLSLDGSENIYELKDKPIEEDLGKTYENNLIEE